MRRKHGLNQQGVHQFLHFFGRFSDGFELDKRVFETTRLVMADFAQVFPPAPYTVHFFSRVNHLEIRRKTADDRQCESRFEITHQGREFLAREFVTFTAADGSQARILDKFEQFRATLLIDQVPDHRPQHAHVVAQGLVFVFERNILAAHFLNSQKKAG